MIPAFPALGIRFDIEKAGGGAYGFECWKVFWRAVDPASLRVALLFEGDTAATLGGSENVFCIVVQADDDVLRDVRTALEQSDEYQRMTASPMFVEGDAVLGEPLPPAGRLDGMGNLTEGMWSEAGLKAVREESGTG